MSDICSTPHARRLQDVLVGPERNLTATQIFRRPPLYRLQTIGEAARKLSDGVVDTHPEIPWQKIMGTRHRLVHDYMQVDFDIVWRIVTEHLPASIPQLEELSRE